MLKPLLPFLLACVFSLHAQARAEIPLENELEDVEEVESAIPDESRVKPEARPKNEPRANSNRTNENPAPTERRQNTAPVQNDYRRNESPGEYREKSASSTGEPIFDWSKHQGESTVKHPFAEKGLIRITKDKTYIYKVEPSKSDKAMSFQVGVLDPKNLRNPDMDTGSTNSTFKENYGQSGNPTLLITKEWDGWVGALGKINYRIGSGAFVAQGHGHFKAEDDPANETKEPMENFTFLAFPTSVGLVYRIQFSDRPLLVPFVEGGATAWIMTEIRDDKKGPKFGVSPSAYGAAGVAIDMTYFDYLTRMHIDQEYGITGIYFTLEYRRMQAIVARYDFSGDYINGGFLMRY